MRFLLDENVHRGLFSFLRELGHDVKLPPKGSKNGEVFELAIREERILITRDADFVDHSLFPTGKHAGIFLLRIHPKDLEAQKKALVGLLKGADGFKGKSVKIVSETEFEFP
jgi:predicted nuclease of predicted toxin-antitoxin system